MLLNVRGPNNQLVRCLLTMFFDSLVQLLLLLVLPALGLPLPIPADGEPSATAGSGKNLG